jgi:hypothetical protein
VAHYKWCRTNWKAKPKKAAKWAAASMRPFAIWLFGVLGAALLGGLASMMAFAPFSVDIGERGDPIWLVPLKVGIAGIVICAAVVALTRAARRRAKKDATEFQVTLAALALTAILLGCCGLSMRFAFGT